MKYEAAVVLKLKFWFHYVLFEIEGGERKPTATNCRLPSSLPKVA